MTRDRFEPEDVRVAAARFCPRCDRGLDGAEGVRLCPKCGDELVDQGYCTVCEGFVRRPPGELCPKHDVPLESLAERAVATDRLPESDRWTTVARFSDPLQADAPRLRLEAEGVPTFLEGERMGRNTVWNAATGGVKLQVPESRVADARVLLSQVWTPPEQDPDADLDDAWDDLAPAPWDHRRRMMKAVVWLLLTPTLVGGVLVIIGLAAAAVSRLIGTR
jgi:hypothetical protein